MTSQEILIVVGISLLVVWVAYRILRSPDEPTSRVPGLHSSGSTPALPPSVVRGNWLIGVGGDVEGKTFHVGARTVTVGRGVSNYIQTTDPDASRVHCRLTPVPSGLRVEDLGSQNGLAINGTRAQEGLLRSGDELQIGKARFQLDASGSYRVDDALGGKVAGLEAQTKTVVDGDLNVQDIARKALDETGGDVPAAAQKLGVSPEVFLRLLE